MQFFFFLGPFASEFVCVLFMLMSLTVYVLLLQILLFYEYFSIFFFVFSLILSLFRATRDRLAKCSDYIYVFSVRHGWCDTIAVADDIASSRCHHNIRTLSPYTFIFKTLLHTYLLLFYTICLLMVFIPYVVAAEK